MLISESLSLSGQISTEVIIDPGNCVARNIW